MKLREKKRPAKWPKAGWYWLLHHDTIVEWTDNIDERWDYVCSEKPYGELAVRQKWMRPVKGTLPEELLTARAKCNEARAKCNEARAKCNKAWAKCNEARAKYYKAWAKYREAQTKYDKAREKCNEARAKYQPQIEALMREELPGVPWDGEQLVFKGEV